MDWGFTDVLDYNGNTYRAACFALHRNLEGHPVWQKDYETFMKIINFEIKLCKPCHPFTKGKVERLVRFVKGNSFRWPGILPCH